MIHHRNSDPHIIREQQDDYEIIYSNVPTMKIREDQETKQPMDNVLIGGQVQD